MHYYVTTDVGALVNRFSQDMTLIDFPLPVSLNQFSERMYTQLQVGNPYRKLNRENRVCQRIR